MPANSTHPVFSADLRGAVLSSYANVAEDGTLCFVSDKVHRACAACGTVFVDSACRAAFAGPPACPYCGDGPSAPVQPRWVS